MEIKKYIESGILESYVLGSASEKEIQELHQLKKQFPEITQALFELETDLERIAQYMAIVPPPDMFTRIEDGINGLVNCPNALPDVKERETSYKKPDNNKGTQFIEVESESSQMRINKVWKWIFATVFVLSKIFLIASIYYYFENRQAQEQVQQLKAELKQQQEVR